MFLCDILSCEYGFTIETLATSVGLIAFCAHRLDGLIVVKSIRGRRRMMIKAIFNLFSKRYRFTTEVPRVKPYMIK